MPPPQSILIGTPLYNLIEQGAQNRSLSDFLKILSQYVTAPIV